MIRIKLTWANFLRNSIIHFRMFLYLETCFLRVTVSLLRRLQSVSKIQVPIHPYLIISEGRRNIIVRPCGRRSSETVTHRKHVNKYKNMWKWLVEFLRKFENRALKLLVNSILHQISQFIVSYFNLYGVWGGPFRCWHL